MHIPGTPAARATTFAALSLLASAHLLPAATFNWKNLLTAGNWSNPNAWSATSPTGADNAGVPNANATVSLLSTDGLARTIQYDYTGAPITLSLLQLDLSGNPLNTVTLNMTANALTVATAYLGATGVNGSGAITQSGGAFTLSATGNGLFLGLNSSTNGAYTLSNTAAATFNNLQVVGYNGAGTFTQTGGTYTINPGFNALYLAYQPGSSGTFNLAGGSLTASCPINVGLSGNGTFNHSAGPLSLIAGQSLSLGINAGSRGTYLLSNSASLNTGSGDEIIGGSGTGAFFQSSGTNTTNNLYFGTNSNGVGAYTLSGGSLAAATLFLGNVGGATGSLAVSGGTLTAGGIYVGYDFFSTGHLSITSGAVAISGGIQFGNTGTFAMSSGTLTTASFAFTSASSSFTWTGGALNVSSATFRVPYSNTTALASPFAATFTGSSDSNANGWVIDNNVSLTAPGTISVGSPGLPRNLSVGDGGSDGTLTLSHPAAAINVNGNLYLGGSAAGAAATNGVLALSAGALSVTGKLVSFPNGPVKLSGGTLSVALLDVTNNPNGFNWSAGTLRLLGGGITGLTSLTIPAAGTLAGSGALLTDVTLNGAIALADPYDNLAVHANVAGPGTVTVAANAFFSANTLRASTVTIAGLARLLPTSPLAGTNKFTALSLAGATNAWTGALDITNAPLVLQPTAANKPAALATLRNQITYGTSHPAGLLSTTSQSDPTHKTTVAIDNALLGLTTFYTQHVDTNSLLVLSTWLGDTNLDRKVNVTDLGTLATYYGQAVPNGILQGDFNQDGLVNVTDLGMLATNYGAGTNGQPFSLATDPSSFPSPIPEPASLGLLALPLLARKSRTRSVSEAHLNSPPPGTPPAQAAKSHRTYLTI